MRAVPDKLTRGMARMEMKKLQREVGDTHPEGSSVIRLLDLVRAVTVPRFSKGKRLTPEAATRLESRVDEFVDTNFKPISRSQYRGHLAGFEGDLDVKTFTYSQINPQNLKSNLDDCTTEFEEDAMEFRFGRYFLDRRRFVLDDFSCNVSFSYHALVRLIQRRACPDEPISFLKTKVDDILPYVPVFLGAAVVSGKSFGIMIPMPDGALMGVYTVTNQPEAIGLHFRRRIMSVNVTSGLVPTPVPNLFPENGDENTMVAIRISTYLSNDMLTTNQKWCRAALMAMMRQNQEIREDVVGMLTRPEKVERDPEVKNRITPIFKDFRSVVESDFWRQAMKLSSPT